jgi:hypothetical protein
MISKTAAQTALLIATGHPTVNDLISIIDHVGAGLIRNRAPINVNETSSRRELHAS